MVARPKDYLRQSLDSATPRCIDFRKGNVDLIILGDLVLRNWIVIYDLATSDLVGQTTIKMAAFIYIGCMVLCFLPWAFPTTLELEKAQPLGMDMNRLRRRDQLRHQQIGVLNFSLQGSADIDSYGFYFTKVKIGSPPQEFSLIVDTGSELSWVSCISCDNCFTSNRFGMPPRLYDPESSSSSSQIYCSSKVCRTTVGLTTQPIRSSCAILDAKCDYKVGYGDGTSSLGYLRSDVLHFNTIAPGSPTFSTTAVFGCNYHLSGRLAESDTAVDRLLGLGRGFYSLVSQLSSVGIAPVFAHCLRGGKKGGGILVFGEIMDPSLVYSPLVSAGDMYNLNLQTIAVDGKIVDIDPVVFSLKNGTGV